MENFKKWIMDRLKTMNLKKTKSLFKSLWVWIVLIIILIAGGLVMLILPTENFQIESLPANDFTSIMLKIGLIIGIPSIGFLIIIGLVNAFRLKSKADKNHSILDESFNEIYQVYADEVGLNYEGLKFIKTSGKNSMFLEINGEAIEWIVVENVEERIRHYIDSSGRSRTKTYYVYILSYKISIDSKKLINVPLIQIKKQDKSFFKGKPVFSKNELESESIEFNRLIDAKSEDRLALTKLFSPTVLDNFVQKGDKFLKGLVLLLENGKATTRAGGFESSVPYYAEFYNFNNVNLSTLTRICSGIVAKVEKDFKFVKSIYEKFEPLNIN